VVVHYLQAILELSLDLVSLVLILVVGIVMMIAEAATVVVDTVAAVVSFDQPRKHLVPGLGTAG
jgi:regulator of protease activity HflC (stomatin/prohibitin superfamily)